MKALELALDCRTGAAGGSGYSFVKLDDVWSLLWPPANSCTEGTEGQPGHVLGRLWD